MSNLAKLVECCQLLETGRGVLERRVQMENLGCLLGNPDIITGLDLNSDRKEKMTWDRVFECVEKFILKEVDNFRTEKPGASVTTMNSRRKKRSDCANLLRLVIRKANEKELRLKTVKLVNHLLAAIHDDFIWECFSLDYSNLFLTDVLGNHRVSREMPLQALNDFIDVYVEMYNKPDSRYDLIMQILEKLIYISSVQFKLNYNLLFGFFNRAIRNYSKLTMGQQQSLMSACLTFCNAVCIDCRLQLCSFGEEILDVVVEMFSSNVPKRFKTILINFLQLQLSCHHPKGAIFEEDGMIAVNKRLWKERLHDLYKVIMNELQKPCFRSKNFIGKNLGLESDILDLVVNVCFQEFKAIESPNDDNEAGPASKKSRQSSRFFDVMDKIQSVGVDSLDVIHWLQLMSALFKKFPTALGCSEDFLRLIQLLRQFALDCKSYITMSYLLDCLRWVFLASVHNVRKESSAPGVAATTGHWSKIYEVLLRSVSLNHCIPEGHALMQEFIASRTVKPGSEMKCLYTPGISPVSQHSLLSLAIVMKHSSLQIFGGNSTTSSDAGVPQNPLLNVRLQLIEWLLPGLADDLGANIFKQNDPPSFGLTAEVLVGLILQDCRTVSMPPDGASKIDVHLAEAAYLLATLDSVGNKAEPGVVEKPLPVVNKACVINAVKDKLIECLLRDCGYLLDSAIAPESIDVITVGSQCCLVAKCLGCMVKHEVMTVIELAECSLCDVLQKLMLRFTNLLHKLCHKEPHSFQKMQTLEQAVAILQQLYFWDGDVKFCKMVSQFCREMTAEKLLDLLVDLLYGTLLPGGCYSAIPTRGSGTVAASHSDEIGESAGNENAVEEAGHNGNAAKAGAGVDGGICLLTVTLSDVENLQLKIARLLILVCQHSRMPLLSPMRPPAASKATVVTGSSVQTRLLTPLTQSAFNTYRSAHVQLVILVMTNLLQPEQELNERHIEILLDILRMTCKLHFKDGEVSAACLDVLATIFLRLNKASQESKEKAMHLISAFWDLKVKKKCGPLVELGIAKVIAALAKCAPEIYFNILPNSSGENNNETQLSPSSLTKFLECRSFRISSFAARNITLLFPDKKTSGSGDANLAESHSRILKLVLHSIRESAVGLDGTLQCKDSQQNWTAAVLIALINVAVLSPFCLKEALRAMCVHAKEIPLSVNLVKKAIQKIARELEYPNLTSFFKAQIGYLAHHRFLGNNFTEFMWRLTDSPSEKDFLMSYYPLIVPHVFATSQQTEKDYFSNLLGRQWTAVVEECFPNILAFVLPVLFSASDNNRSAAVAPSEKLKAAACLNLLVEILDQRVVDRLLANRLPEVVVAVLKCLHVVIPEGEVAVMAVPKPNPPFFSPDLISGAFQYVTASCSQKGATLISVLTKMQDGLQNVLLALNIHLEDSHEPHEIFRALQMYAFFVRLILEEFDSGLNGDWAFVLQDIIYVLAHQMARFHSSNLKDSAIFSSKLLYDVVEKAVTVCPTELSKYVSTIVNCSLVFVKDDSSSTLAKQIFAIFKLLFGAENKLGDALVLLEPFPDWPNLSDLKRKHLAIKYGKGPLTLKEEILNFLQVFETRQRMDHAHGLMFIEQLLRSKKDEFKDLVAELEGARFSDECKKIVLYRLVVELIHLCTCSTSSSEVCHSAAKCLGEIGPIPLSTIVLQADTPKNEYHSALQRFNRDATSQCYAVVFHMLHSYIIGPCVQTKRVASEVLKRLLSTKTGYDFHMTYQGKKVAFLFEYLHPFLCKKKPLPDPVPAVSGEEFARLVDAPTLWCPEQTKHEDWIRNLVCTLIDSGGSKCEIIRLLKPICQSKAEFCEKLLPYLVHAILKNDPDRSYRGVLSRQIGAFFSRFCDRTDSASRPSTPFSSQSTGEDVGTGPIYNDRKSIKVLLDVVKFLRLQDRPKLRGSTLTSWDNNFWLDLNYLRLAKAANFCKAYLTALLFAEIWWDIKLKKSDAGNQLIDLGSGSSSGLPMVSISSCCSEEGSAAQGLMLEVIFPNFALRIYRNIGDPDAIYGCGASHLTDPCSRLHFYEKERQWERALSAYDLALDSNLGVSQKGMLQAMYKMGLHHLSRNYFQNMASNAECSDNLDSIREYRYQCAWKLAQWSLPAPCLEESAPAFDSSVYEALGALHENDEGRFRFASTRAYQAVVEKLQMGSLESTDSLYLPLADLAALNHLENCFELKSKNDVNRLHAFLEKWTRGDTLFRSDYDVLEPFISMQHSVLQLLSNANPQNAYFRTALVDCLERHSNLARENGLLHWAETCIVRLRKIPGIRTDRKFAWKFEEAKIFWAHSERDTAKSLLSALIRELEQREDLKNSILYAQTLAVYGNWLIETRSESASVVLENYLEKSIAMQKTKDVAGSSDFLMDTYLAAARYADAQYQHAANYVKSCDYQSKQEMILRSNEAVEQLKALGKRDLSNDQRRAMIILERQTELDKQELQSVQARKHRFLLKSVRNYISCLLSGDAHDNRIFRLVSLWFDNMDNDEVNQLVKGSVLSIPSHKFLPLIYQLAARMSSKGPKSLFNSTLTQLILQLTKDHPYHTLHVILALCNASKDEAYIETAKKSRKVDEDRVLAAKHVLEILRKGVLCKIIRDLENLSDTLMDFSYWKHSGSKPTGTFTIPSNQKILKIRDLTRIPPMTMTIKVDPSCKYENVPGILKYGPEYKLCGGVNVPKQIRCFSSDGKERLELVKGRDDLRQDAVMQQVFAMVNYLLCKNPETSQRKLQIRTYKVVPLSQRSGILEWCNNTKPVAEYLVNEGAHKRINPSDWDVIKCRKTMMTYATQPADKKFEVYKEICANFKPVFHHFFLETFPDPPAWFEKRTAYTKSVATNSIVGYILGLGDRHVSNILVDLQTTELIHIDLGVAFDQGKLLPTPETVPFRLTRDIVDGMGCMGTEGIFRRCCEKTMQVMHASQEVIVTILEVLLYDPLYEWTLSPMKACKLQNQREELDKSTAETINVGASSIDSSFNERLSLDHPNSSPKNKDINKLAERVLLRLQEKLQGKEDDTILSVAGQVAQLIQQAVDPYNLCRVFHGWQPYL